MNESELKTVVIEALTSVAPDVEPDKIEPETNFRDQFDFDSMDFLNFIIALHEKLGVDIPELDYPKLSSLDGCTSYLKKKT